MTTPVRLVAYRDRIDAWLHQGRLQITRIQEKLGQAGCPVPYTSLRRFLARQGWLKAPGSTVWLADTKPDECAEMDFGRLAPSSIPPPSASAPSGH